MYTTHLNLTQNRQEHLPRWVVYRIRHHKHERERRINGAALDEHCPDRGIHLLRLSASPHCLPHRETMRNEASRNESGDEDIQTGGESSICD